MANPNFKPEEKYRERIFLLFQELTEKKSGPNRGISRGEIEKEIRSHPEKYPDLVTLTESYLKIIITKILNTDPRALPNPVWRKVWMLPEMTT